jgi:hypothetical protein
MGIKTWRNKPAKALERVKGIEPSYSAWKAAALPLSYTRARPINYHGRKVASTAMRGTRTLMRVFVPPAPLPSGPLTGADSVPILMFPSTQRKEVIQCLLPSAVTSLGSPAKLSISFAKGALSAWTSECKCWTRREQSRRVFLSGACGYRSFPIKIRTG